MAQAQGQHAGPFKYRWCGFIPEGGGDTCEIHTEIWPDPLRYLCHLTSLIYLWVSQGHTTVYAQDLGSYWWKVDAVLKKKQKITLNIVDLKFKQYVEKNITNIEENEYRNVEDGCMKYR
jgi:hypothetical protein